MAATFVEVGPWGGEGGDNPWTFQPDGRISKILISTEGCVYSLRFSYIDHDDVEHNSETYGGDGGSPQTITIADDETFIGISGTVGPYGGFTVITSLSFKTNKNTYGPYGATQGSNFSLPVTRGTFTGFSGNYGIYLDSFAAILQPY